MAMLLPSRDQLCRPCRQHILAAPSGNLGTALRNVEEPSLIVNMGSFRERFSLCLSFTHCPTPARRGGKSDPYFYNSHRRRKALGALRASRASRTTLRSEEHTSELQSRLHL